MNERLIEIRRAEERSHNEIYSTFELFAPGSWLAKPVRTVLELLPLFDGASSFCALDLGCGVGRNSIPIAQYFQNRPCRVDCVDILASAIDKLRQNAQRYGTEASIQGHAAAIEEYPIPAGQYDLILAVSALEHVSSKECFITVLQAIRSGLRPGGIACLIVNTNVTEHDKISGVPLPPQFEVTVSADEFFHTADRIFSDCRILKHSIVHQKYDIPRETGVVALETDVATCVFQGNDL
jgi:SAM-dependent methyltransferase